MSKQKKLSTRPAVAKQPLAVFMHEKARAGCLVCALPKEIRAQLGRAATKSGFSRPDQVEWLRVACSASTVTLDILNTHLNSRHDREEDLHGTS